MSEKRKKPGVTFYATVLLVALPLLYVLSSGPTLMVAARFLTAGPTSDTYAYTGPFSYRHLLEFDEWWTTLYGPLPRASEQKWGKPLRWYWELFPLPVVWSYQAGNLPAATAVNSPATQPDPTDSP